MILQLSNSTVSIKDNFTWGDKEKIQNIYIKGAKVDQSGMKEFDTYVLLEIMVEAIDEGEDRKAFTREWMNSLSLEDGDLLYSTVEEITSPKKKAWQS